MLIQYSFQVIYLYILILYILICPSRFVLLMGLDKGE